MFVLNNGITAFGTAALFARENGLKKAALFVIDLHAEGVTVEPIETMNVEPFYRVRFTDAVVPDDRVVGPVDGGWLGR